MRGDRGRSRPRAAATDPADSQPWLFQLSGRHRRPRLAAAGDRRLYRATEFRDAEGRTVPSPTDVNVIATQTQIGFLARQRILGAYWGADVQLPIARIETRLGPRHRMTETGVGDLIVSPLILQWPPRPLFGRPFSQRLSLTAILPTGDYDSSRPVNPGDHAIHFNPYYAATWELTPRWDLTARVHYLWNGKNSDPPVAMGAQFHPGRPSHSCELLHLIRADARPSGRFGRLCVTAADRRQDRSRGAATLSRARHCSGSGTDVAPSRHDAGRKHLYGVRRAQPA